MSGASPLSPDLISGCAQIAQLGRVRQFLATDAADRITDILRRRLVDAVFIQTLTHRAVVQVQPACPAEHKTHSQDQPAEMSMYRCVSAINPMISP